MQDAYGSPLTFSGSGTDTMMLALLRAVYSKESDSQLIASMEQACPLHTQWLVYDVVPLKGTTYFDWISFVSVGLEISLTKTMYLLNFWSLRYNCEVTFVRGRRIGAFTHV
jgi:hypothetical protein